MNIKVHAVLIAVVAFIVIGAARRSDADVAASSPDGIDRAQHTPFRPLPANVHRSAGHLS